MNYWGLCYGVQSVWNSQMGQGTDSVTAANDVLQKLKTTEPLHRFFFFFAGGGGCSRVVSFI